MDLFQRVEKRGAFDSNEWEMGQKLFQRLERSGERRKAGIGTKARSNRLTLRIYRLQMNAALGILPIRWLFTK